MMINPEAVTQEIECPKEHPFLLCPPNHGRSFSIPHEVKRISCDKPIHKSFYIDGQTHGSKYFSGGLEPQGPQSQVPGRTPRHCLASPPRVRLQVTAEPRCNIFPDPPAPINALISKLPVDEQVWLYPKQICTSPGSPGHLQAPRQEPRSPSGNERTGWMQESSWDRRSSRGASYWMSSVEGLRVPHRAHEGFTSQLQHARLPRWACGDTGDSHTQHTWPGTAQGKHPKMQLYLFDIPCMVIYRNTCWIYIYTSKVSKIKLYLRYSSYTLLSIRI